MYNKARRFYFHSFYKYYYFKYGTYKFNILLKVDWQVDYKFYLSRYNLKGIRQQKNIMNLGLRHPLLNKRGYHTNKYYKKRGNNQPYRSHKKKTTRKHNSRGRKKRFRYNKKKSMQEIGLNEGAILKYLQESHPQTVDMINEFTVEWVGGRSIKELISRLRHYNYIFSKKGVRQNIKSTRCLQN